MDGGRDGAKEAWMDGRMDGRTDGQMDGWTDGRTEEVTRHHIYIYTCIWNVEFFRRFAVKPGFGPMVRRKNWDHLNLPHPVFTVGSVGFRVGSVGCGFRIQGLGFRI